jgi:enoyl-CoA hydratase/carnithine racemase
MFDLVSFERQGHLALIGLNRPDKRNAFTWEMMEQLSGAYTSYELDDQLRCAVLFGHGGHFSAGMELNEIAPKWLPAQASHPTPPGQCDPWRVFGRQISKPLVSAVHGACMTLAIELLLAGDISIASSDSKFGQLEVTRGIYPFGGSTIRFPQVVGYHNAMRWILTGDILDANEAHRIGLVQEVVEPGRQLARAVAIAERIAAAAPLGVRASLRTARRALDHGHRAAIDTLHIEVAGLHGTEDAKLGADTFLDKVRPHFSGR